MKNALLDCYSKPKVPVLRGKNEKYVAQFQFTNISYSDYIFIIRPQKLKMNWVKLRGLSRLKARGCFNYSVSFLAMMRKSFGKVGFASKNN